MNLRDFGTIFRGKNGDFGVTKGLWVDVGSFGADFGVKTAGFGADNEPGSFQRETGRIWGEKGGFWGLPFNIFSPQNPAAGRSGAAAGAGAATTDTGEVVLGPNPALLAFPRPPVPFWG